MIFSAGITDRARNESVMKGAAISTPSPASRAWSDSRSATTLDRPFGQEARPGGPAHRAQTPGVGNHAAAAQLLQALGAGEDVGVGHAHGHQVVRVVGDRGGERAAAKAEAGHQPGAHSAAGVVALDHGDLGQVAAGVGDHAPVLAGGLLLAHARDQLLGDDLDHPDTRRDASVECDVCLGEPTRVDRLQQVGGHPRGIEGLGAALARHHPAAGQHEGGGETLEVVQ